MGLVLGGLLDVIAPPRCGCCRRRIYGMDPPWCVACGDDVVVLVPDCLRCAAPEARVAGPCPAAHGPVERVVAPYAWTATVATTVRAGKIGGAHAVFEPLGRILGAHVAVTTDATDIDLVCPVPAHPRSRRRRGFDHAQLLARGVGARLDRGVQAVLTMSSRTPDRGSSMPDEPHVAHAWERRARMRTVAAVAGHVLLVDDVVTTMTTVTAAATALRAGGAARVSVAAVARAGRH